MHREQRTGCWSPYTTGELTSTSFLLVPLGCRVPIRPLRMQLFSELRLLIVVSGCSLDLPVQMVYKKWSASYTDSDDPLRHSQSTSIASSSTSNIVLSQGFAIDHRSQVRDDWGPDVGRGGSGQTLLFLLGMLFSVYASRWAFRLHRSTGKPLGAIFGSLWKWPVDGQPTSLRAFVGFESWETPNSPVMHLLSAGPSGSSFASTKESRNDRWFHFLLRYVHIVRSSIPNFRSRKAMFLSTKLESIFCSLPSKAYQGKALSFSVKLSGNLPSHKCSEVICCVRRFKTLNLTALLSMPSIRSLAADPAAQRGGASSSFVPGGESDASGRRSAGKSHLWVSLRLCLWMFVRVSDWIP